MRFVPLLLLALAGQALAGVQIVDFELRVRLCPDVSSLSEYRLWKHEGATSVYEDLTQAEYDDLSSDASAGCTTFAATASTILGTWYTDLGTTDRANLCTFFDRLDP